MEKTVVCYLIKDNKYLMLYRNKKTVDYNKGKWITIGGHIENGETPEEAMIREVKEESGYNVLDYKKIGVVHFLGDLEEIMHVYVSHSFDGNEIECDEGTLKWVDKKDILSLNMWEGDYKFINNVFEEKIFDIALLYKDGKLTGEKRFIG